MENTPLYALISGFLVKNVQSQCDLQHKLHNVQFILFSFIIFNYILKFRLFYNLIKELIKSCSKLDFKTEVETFEYILYIYFEYIEKLFNHIFSSLKDKPVIFRNLKELTIFV